MSPLNSALSGLESRLAGLGHLTGGVALGELIAHGIEGAVDKAMELAKEAIKGAAEFLKSSFEEAVTAIRVDTVLETSIRNAGKAATFTAGELEKLAEVWSDKTTFDHKDIEKAESALVNLGVEGDNLMDALRTSMDVASAKFEDLASASDTLGKALANPDKAVMTLRRSHLLGAEAAEQLADALAKANSAGEEQRAIIDALNKTYQNQATTVAENAGFVDQLKHAWSDMKEQVGRQLVPIAKEYLPAIKFEIVEIGKAIIELIKHIAEWGSSWGAEHGLKHDREREVRAVDCGHREQAGEGNPQDQGVVLLAAHIQRANARPLVQR
jgi:hypothetical protein